MKFPLSLLKQFITTDATLEEITTTLTRIGLEVEGVENKAASLAPFTVAHVLSAKQHPNSDRLQVCEVQTSSETLQIVCGAPNARAGLKVALASIGSTIPANGLVIKKSKIRDVESCGMLCSAAELGLSEDSEGIIELPAEAKIGAPIAEVLGLNDPVIEIAITPNRGDCFGVYGVARDLAAAGLGALCHPQQREGSEVDASASPANDIQDKDGCPEIFFRRITGVKNGQSPAWLQQVLQAAGMRPISALVDITNYFTLAYGRPLHVFDAAKISGKLTVRRAQNGETLAALNEKTYVLTEADCVIADDANVLALAGIMGGTESGVSESTTDIVLEVAMFTPERIAKSGQHHQIISDARMRFERGVDPAFLRTAEALATAMITQICGGKVGELRYSGSAPAPRTAIAWSPTFIEKRSGLNVPPSDCERILKALGFTLNGNLATPPSWRHDVTCREDIAEEILRIVGYDTIPTISLPKPAGNIAPAVDAKAAQLGRTRRALAVRGLFETVSFAFISEDQAALFAAKNSALNVQNPIASNLSTMRPNLLPGLLIAAHANLARAQKTVHLFEAGSVFSGTLPQDETTQLAAIRCGENPLHWQPAAAVDVFSAKADAFSALEQFGVNTDNVQITRNVPSWYHPGRAGAISLGPKNILAYFGALHPSVLKAFDIEVPVFACEIMLAALPTTKPAKRTAAALSEYQAVTRDFAFVVPDSVEAGSLQKAMKRAGGAHVTDVALFDVYRGKGVAEGHVSLAFTATLQAMDKTLSEADISAAADAIILAAQKLGGQLRG